AYTSPQIGRLQLYHLADSAAGVHRRLEDADARQLAVALGVVQAVADDKFRRYVEPDIADRHVDLDGVRLAEEGDDLDRGGLPALQVAQQPLQGEPGVDDVLHDDHVAAGDVAVEV